MITAAILGLVTATSLALHCGAKTVIDQDRPASLIRYVDRYNNLPQPHVGTATFGELLAAHKGEDLRVCVRSHADKPGSLGVMIPRATDQFLKIRTPVGSHYRTRCVTFTVLGRPRIWPGFVQVDDRGVIGRRDWIRNVSIRLP